MSTTTKVCSPKVDVSPAGVGFMQDKHMSGLIGTPALLIASSDMQTELSLAWKQEHKLQDDGTLSVQLTNLVTRSLFTMRAHDIREEPGRENKLMLSSGPVVAAELLADPDKALFRRGLGIPEGCTLAIEGEYHIPAGIAAASTLRRNPRGGEDGPKADEAFYSAYVGLELDDETKVAKPFLIDAANINEENFAGAQGNNRALIYGLLQYTPDRGILYGTLDDTQRQEPDLGSTLAAMILGGDSANGLPPEILRALAGARGR